MGMLQVFIWLQLLDLLFESPDPDVAISISKEDEN
ncbi:hypothetical protein SOVF_177970 [Spinacia oleracea]|nr:hypothetical protein SOVF_177970 [Spinacia oleracea]